MSSTPTHKIADGPKGHWLLGVIPEFRKNPLAFLVKAHAQYGDVVRFRLGHRLIHSLADPEHVKQVLVDRSAHFTKGALYAKLKYFMGEGLLTSVGEPWKRQRRLAQPAFHHQKIAAFGTMMGEAALSMVKRWEGQREFDLTPEMMRVTLEIVSRSLFGHDLGREADAVGEALTVGLHFVQKRVEAFIDVPLWVPIPENREFKKSIKILDDIVLGIIEKRRKSGGDHDDLLAMLMEAQDEETGERMSDAQLRDEIMTLLMAGHETTANALTWIFYLLDRHPEVQDKLREETAFLAGKPPALSDLKQLPFTRMVIDEGLRLYPPAWILGRSPRHDENFGGYHVPAKSIVWISPYLTQHHPAHWNDPEKFDPQRFAPGAGETRHKYAYFPFGGGPRLCIGNNLALMEAQIILATVIQHYRLKLSPGHPVAMEPKVTLRPLYGMKMRLS